MELNTMRCRRPIMGGITLVETMVTLAVLGILASVAAPSLRNFILDRKLAGAAAHFHSNVNWARSQAVQSGRPVTVQVSQLQTGSCYAVFTGSPSECGCSAAAGSCAPPSTQLLVESFDTASGIAVTTSSNAGFMTFDPVRGTTTPVMTATFSASNGNSIRQITNLMGRSRTCSPNGTGNNPAC